MSTALRDRIVFETPPWLPLGDLACIALFVLAGEFSHFDEAGRALARAPETALPFVLGWAIAAPAVGGYAAGAVAGPRRAAGLALVAWTGAAAIGLALRATDAVHGGVAPTFAIVALVVAGGLLAVWRGACGWWLGRARSRASTPGGRADGR